MSGSTYPLKGIKVVEFSHMVLGPSCGLILADLGADVVKVEPAPKGDKTRYLPGSGSGFFGSDRNALIGNLSYIAAYSGKYVSK